MHTNAIICYNFVKKQQLFKNNDKTEKNKNAAPAKRVPHTMERTTKRGNRIETYIGRSKHLSAPEVLRGYLFPEYHLCLHTGCSLHF